MAAPAAGASAFARPAPEEGGKVAKPPTCPAKFDDSLETNGIVPTGRARGVIQPKPLFTPEAEFSEKTRKEINKKRLRPFFSVSVLSFVVDKNGNPQDLCVKKPGEFDLDEQPAKAVMQYRFEPAMKDGNPVRDADLDRAELCNSLNPPMTHHWVLGSPGWGYSCGTSDRQRCWR